MSTRPIHLQGRPTSPAPRTTQSTARPSPRPIAKFDWEATQLAQELREAMSRPAFGRLTGRPTAKASVAQGAMAMEFRTETVLQRLRLARNICWPAIRREFEVDPGQSFFVRVQQTTLNDWRALVASLRQSGRKHTIERFGSRINPFASPLRHHLTVHLSDELKLVCRAKKQNCIEMSFDPQHIASEADFRLLCSFIAQLYQVLGRNVELTDGEQALFRASVDSEGLVVWCPKDADLE